MVIYLKHIRYAIVGFGLLCSTSAVAQTEQGKEKVESASKAKADTMDVDTMRVVTVRPNSVRLPLSNRTREELEGITNAQRNSLGGILQRVAPTFQDQILHPFGFAERKKNRKRKKVQKVLEQYDAVDKKDPLQLLLDSVANEMKARSEIK